MKKLDFISSSPQLSIFRESSNKNNLGGVLFLIFIIIFILLAIAYISDFAINARYNFTYTYMKETYDESGTKEANNQRYDNLYKDIEFKFNLAKDYANIPLNSSNFELRFQNLSNRNQSTPIEINNTITINTGDFRLFVLYKCDTTVSPPNCNIREEDKIDKYGRSYFLNMYYKGYDLYHQDPDSPIKKSDEFKWEVIEFLENTNIVYLNWGLIEYEEEKGIFEKNFDRFRNKKNTYYGGDIKSKQSFTDDGHVKKCWDESHIVLLILEIHPVNSQFDRYTRKENSIWDVLANICALSSTVFNIITLIYGHLYSKNYDNYKIVEKILSKKIGINIYNKKIKDIEDTKFELKKDLINSNDNNYQSEDNININDENNDENEEKKATTSIKFYDFFVHLFYSKCCGYSKKHSLIDSYNNIIAKYMTFDNLFYNQIRLENLLKDYKWNDPQYEFKEKNDSLLELT